MAAVRAGLPGSLGSWMEIMSAPPEARAVVMARPRPPEPPVTMAVLPVREKRLGMLTIGAVLGAIMSEGRSLFFWCFAGIKFELLMDVVLRILFKLGGRGRY